MSNENLTKESKTEWARIDAMSDDEIDFSDIPPITDEMWERGVWRKGVNEKNGRHLIVVDNDVIEFFKKQKGDYKETINRLLRNYVETHQTEKV